ncbi:MAG: hypothetical protein QM764_24685 [Chitinophagaceae bacterium]
MPKVILSFLLTLLAMLCFSQEKKNFTQSREFALKLEDRYKGSETIPFKTITVKDVRFDTTKLGYVYNVYKHSLNKITTKESSSNSLTNTVSDYFQNNFVSSSEKSLLIIVKSFWFQQKAFDLVVNDKIVKKQKNYTDKTGVCFADFEVFSFSGDGYQALLKFKYDFVDYQYDSASIQRLFYIPFDSLFRKLHSLDIQQVLSSKKQFTWNKIDSNYSNRYALPVLQSEVAEKGVFLTFNDFKIKNQVYPDFRIVKGDLTDELYIRKDGKEELLIDCWGYSDGQNYFIRIGYNFFKLIRQNNTFDLLGSKYINSYPKSGVPVPLGGGAYGTAEVQLHKDKLELRPLQLNMDTGETY